MTVCRHCGGPIDYAPGWSDDGGAWVHVGQGRMVGRRCGDDVDTFAEPSEVTS